MAPCCASLRDETLYTAYWVQLNKYYPALALSKVQSEFCSLEGLWVPEFSTSIFLPVFTPTPSFNRVHLNSFSAPWTSGHWSNSRHLALLLKVVITGATEFKGSRIITSYTCAIRVQFCWQCILNYSTSPLLPKSELWKSPSCCITGLMVETGPSRSQSWPTRINSSTSLSYLKSNSFSLWLNIEPWKCSSKSNY